MERAQNPGLRTVGYRARMSRAIFVTPLRRLAILLALLPR
jgi:hypothetical protein